MSVRFRTSDGVTVPFPYATTRLSAINRYYNERYNNDIIDVDIPFDIWKNAVLFAKLSEIADQNVEEYTRVKLILQQCKLNDDKIDNVIQALEILGSDIDANYLKYYKSKRF